MIGMVVFALCGTTAAALPPVISLDGRSTYDLAGQLEMYREPAGKLTIDDINKGVDTEKFQPVGQAAVALGQITDAVWFRARLRNDAAEKLHVNWAINYIFLENIDIYQIENHQVVDHLLLGKVMPYSARRVKVDPYIFPVTLQAGEEAEIIWRIKSGVPMLIPFMLTDDIALAHYEGANSTRVGIYIGIMSGMAFYNLFLFLAIRDRAYLYYVFFIAFGSLVQAALLGVLDKFTPEAVAFNRMNGNLTSSLAICFGILFSMRMLEVQHLSPLLQRVLKGFIVFFCALYRRLDSQYHQYSYTTYGGRWCDESDRVGRCHLSCQAGQCACALFFDGLDGLDRGCRHSQQPLCRRIALQ